MKLLPIRYSVNVEAAVRFYSALGLNVSARSRPGRWIELEALAGLLGIHEATPGAVACELAFESDEALENVVDRLATAGYTADPILDENFGRSVRVLDPDGVWVQINESDRELYT